jgi:CheY-like chemotaxis protein
MAKSKILVVDDTPISRAALALMLECAGYEVEEAPNGPSALSKFKPGLYAAIIMDFNMPSMNGFECTAKIRALETESGTHIPIICMSTENKPGMKDRCLLAGLDDFLDKACHSDELIATLQRLTRLDP